MPRISPSPFPFPPRRSYRGADVPMRVIRRYAQAIADEFHPEKIILFGSHAYGTPTEDSDVDLLVIMPTRNQHDQAVRILYRLAAPFPLDLIVRTKRMYLPDVNVWLACVFEGQICDAGFLSRYGKDSTVLMGESAPLSEWQQDEKPHRVRIVACEWDRSGLP